MKIKAFIDGQEGTTGLQIRERLLSHPDVTLLEIDREKRKDASARRTLIGDSDVTFLCLPDGAAATTASSNLLARFRRSA